jgi:hypothetical protein
MALPDNASSVLKLHVDDACAYRRRECGMVLLSQIGIRERKLAIASSKSSPLPT